MTPDLDTLEKLARGANAGLEWDEYGGLAIPLARSEGAPTHYMIPGHMIRRDFSEYLKTAANPQTILSLIAALREADGALEKILQFRGKTQLADCCVNRTCTPHYEDGEKEAHCSWQAGVARGFGESAAEAEEALTRIRALKGEK
jgi:hypothetical protein